MKTQKSQKIYWILFGITCLLFCGLYISLIFNQNIWTDEAYTIQLIRENSFTGIITGTANDVHPPLYYLMLKIFINVFGDSIPVYKLFSICPLILCFVLAGTKIRKYWGEQTSLLFVFFINAIPCLLEYVIQIRMYSWALLWVTWAAVSAYGVYRERGISNQLQLTMATLLACYTHNYAMISCVIIYGILAVTLLRKPKQWLISGVIVAVCYIPWLLVLYQQTMNRIGNYWIDPVTGKEIVGYTGFLFDSSIPYSSWMLGLLCIMAVVQCVKATRAKEERGAVALCMLGVPLLTATIGIIVSIVVTPFFIARYLIPCIGLLALFLAISFGGQKTDLKILLILFSCVMFVSAYRINYTKEYESTRTQELLDYMNENMGENDYILYNYEIYGFIYQIYFDEERTIFLGNMDFSQDFDTLWFFDSCVTPWLDSQTLENYQLQKEFIGRMGIEQNEFSLYRITHK